MKIRKATKKDAMDIAKLIQKYLGKDYKPSRFKKKIIEEKMAQRKNKIFVATENSKIIGVIRTDRVDIDLADFRWLVVEDKFQRQGIGRRLLIHTLEFLRKQKFRKVITRTKAKNNVTLHLFRSLGFKQEGYFKEHY